MTEPMIVTVQWVKKKGLRAKLARFLYRYMRDKWLFFELNVRLHSWGWGYEEVNKRPLNPFV